MVVIISGITCFRWFYETACSNHTASSKICILEKFNWNIIIKNHKLVNYCHAVNFERKRNLIEVLTFVRSSSAKWCIPVRIIISAWLMKDCYFMWWMIMQISTLWILMWIALITIQSSNCNESKKKIRKIISVHNMRVVYLIKWIKTGIKNYQKNS